MATKKKLLQAAAGSAGGAGLDVDEVFSTFLYEGNGSTRTITNGIDLSGEGGMVWIKNRSIADYHSITDTTQAYDSNYSAYARGFTNATSAFGAHSVGGVSSFNANGFSINTGNSEWNSSGDDFVSWTFRKAPKFFDIVTYSGNSTNRTISHNLGTTVGFMVVKRTSGSGTNWMCFHRSVGATKGAILNGSNTFSEDSTTWNNTAPTSSVFSLGTDANVNQTGHDYVAYLFAHNDDDGEFGPDSDQDIIKCGSYTGNGNADGPTIDLGFEPQWLIIKNADNGFNWIIQDAQRGITTGSDSPYLMPNTSDPEYTLEWLNLTPTGFKIATTNGLVNGNGNNHIYIAIRRGPLAVPDDATKVFAIDTVTSDSPAVDLDSGFPVDLLFTKRRDGGDSKVVPRLTMTRMDAGSTGSEGSASSFCEFDHMDKVVRLPFLGGASTVDYMWKRAPSYFDVVAYSGTGSARTVNHNLGVAPEMMWIKNRDASEDWIVYHKDVGATKYLMLSRADVETTNSTRFNDTTPTASVFTVGTDQSVNSPSGHGHIAYLFATAPGVSKVGSYTGDGTTDGSKFIDCGFTNGPSFVIIKIYDGEDANNWFVFDSVRGIVAGSEPRLFLNNTLAEGAALDYIDPHSSGFFVGCASNTRNSTNVSGSKYIFYAIA